MVDHVGQSSNVFCFGLREGTLSSNFFPNSLYVLLCTGLTVHMEPLIALDLAASVTQFHQLCLEACGQNKRDSVNRFISLYLSSIDFNFQLLPFPYHTCPTDPVISHTYVKPFMAMLFFERRGKWARKSNLDLDLDVNKDVDAYYFIFKFIFECPERSGTERSFSSFSFAVRFVFAFALAFLEGFEVVRWRVSGYRSQEHMQIVKEA